MSTDILNKKYYKNVNLFTYICLVATVVLVHFPSDLCPLFVVCNVHVWRPSICNLNVYSLASRGGVFGPQRMGFNLL